MATAHHDCVGCPYATRRERNETVTAFGGEFVVDLQCSRLVINGQERRVYPQQARIFAALAVAQGDLVSRDRLHLAVWGFEGPDANEAKKLRLRVMGCRRSLYAAGAPFVIHVDRLRGWSLARGTPQRNYGPAKRDRRGYAPPSRRQEARA